MASKRTTLPELRRYDYVVQLLLPHLSFASLTVKISREVNAPKRDNLVDLAGYAACAQRCTDRALELEHEP